MRRSTLMTALLVAACQVALVASAEQLRGPQQGRDARRSPTSHELSVEKVALTPDQLQAAELKAAAATANGQRPIVLLETNYYTFVPGDPLQLRMTVHPNGFSATATMYLYREDRLSGARRYYNIGADALLPQGQIADLFGTAGSPQAIVLPTVEDLVLLGTATDSVEIGWGINGALGASMVVPAGETGLYQWVLEVRGAAGARVISRSNAMFSHVEDTVSISGTLSTATWTANNRYVLNDFVFVPDGATLTIEPGTVVYGGDSRASLFVSRGGKIIADGTSRRPIVMTSALKVGDRAQRDWGSLIVLGRAPINEPGGEGFIEGLPSQSQFAFGGADPADSSGVLRYLRLEFGGFEIETNQEINGLTLGACGTGTVIEYVQVLHNKDDAFEFFGGTVNARYLLAVAPADDTVDWDLGFQGSVQFVVNVKRGVNDENDGNLIIEGDGHPQNFELTPLSNPKLYNVTGYGTGRTDVGAYGNVIRRGSAGKVHNLIITGSRRAPATIRDDASFNNAANGELVFDNSILFGDFSDDAFGSGSDRPADTREFLFQTMAANRNVDPMLAIGAPSHVKTLMPDLAPLADSPALDVDYVATPPDDGFLVPVDFIGGVGPNDNWPLSGWANFSDN